MLSTNDSVSNNEDCMKDPTMTWWGAKKRDSKAIMSDGELLDYFEGRLATAPDCGSQNCNCLSILLIPSVITSIASYLVFFERQSKHQQDTILLDWIIYRIALPQSKCHFFRVPFDGNVIENNVDAVDDIQAHFLCSKGLQIMLNISKKRWARLRRVSTSSSILPADGRRGNGNAQMKADDPRLPALIHNLEYMLNLGEVRATRVVSTLVDGEIGQANRNDTVDMIHLPISMGYWSCYKRYMASLGHDVRCKANGSIIVDGTKEGKPIDHGFVSFSTYYYKWKASYPQLKVSRPAEDICQYCFAFSNRHRHLADHSATEGVFR